MGCCSSKCNLKENPEKRICETEDKLEIRILSAEKVDRMIHRYSKYLKVSQIQFEMFCKELPLEKNSLSYDFFQLFYNENEENYDVRILSSVAILYCYGTDEEKIKQLFQNYDIDSSKTISPDELKQMIGDLTKIALLSSSDLAFSNKNCEKLYDINSNLSMDYQKELASIRPILISYYSSFILESHPDNIKIDDFQEILMKKDIISLIFPHKMRELCLNIKESLSKTVALVEKIMDDPKCIDRSITRRLSMKLSHEKRSNSYG